MAQTKRKRRSKHRGNAGGTVVTRGRTGRKLTEAERKQQARAQAKGARLARYDKPPTLRGSLIKGGLATAFFVVMLVVVFKRPATSALITAAFVMVVYTAMTYYTDLFVFRRRQKRKARG